ncbi:aminoacyl-tRNA hydrolase [bacterium]
MSTFLIAGLGNPGMQYEYTKHNLGFLVLDAQAKMKNQRFCKGPGTYHWLHMSIEDKEVVLLKPMTFMNRSGIAIADAQNRLKIPMDQCLIIHDDLALPLGQLRLRARGSDGGHNGLASILNYLHSKEVPRLRMGIGNKDNENTIRYVLSPFSKQNQPIVKQMVIQAVQAIYSFVINGIHPAMNAINTSI